MKARLCVQSLVRLGRFGLGTLPLYGLGGLALHPVRSLGRLWRTQAMRNVVPQAHNADDTCYLCVYV